MKELVREEPEILAAAERQMRAWEYLQETGGRVLHAHEAHKAAEPAIAYIAISRQSGAGGCDIARLVGQKLGWDVLDKNLLDRMAERFHLSRAMLEQVDETPGNWVSDVLGPWMDHTVIAHEKYLVRLRAVIRAAARRGRVVLVGRGAQFFLPRQQGLSVRLIAPEKYRIQRIMKVRGLSEPDARQFMEQVDSNRRQFVRRYFHRDLNDPHLFDLVINVEHFGSEGAVGLILAAFNR